MSPPFSQPVVQPGFSDPLQGSPAREEGGVPESELDPEFLTQGEGFSYYSMVKTQEILHLHSQQYHQCKFQFLQCNLMGIGFPQRMG